MDNIQRRRILWSKALPCMNILYKLYGLIPRSICRMKLEKTRFKTGWVAIAKSFSMLKRLGTILQEMTTI